MIILLIAMPESIYATRWINKITDQGWKIYLFSYTPGLCKCIKKNVYNFRRYTNLPVVLAEHALFPVVGSKILCRKWKVF